MSGMANASMSRRPNRRNRGTNRIEVNNRRLICAEAARIMTEESVRDFHTAKRKAATRLNLPETKNLPTNLEVETALKEYMTLFHSGTLSKTLRHLREIAAEAMRFLNKFDPRLVGPVLSGTVTPTSEVHLHVSADTPEEVAFALEGANIPYDSSNRKLRYGGDRNESFPAYRFIADTATIEVCVFSHNTVRETPLSPVDGKTMRRASLREVEGLLDENSNTS